MRVVFMGTPDFAVPVLQELLKEGHQVAGVVTQPDRPKGRGQKVSPSPVKKFALRQGLVVYQPFRLEAPDFIGELRRLDPEVIVVAAFGQILPVEILNLPRHGCINVHASLLPKYRGSAPVHRAIMNGEKVTGVTTMLMDEGLDTGNILLQEATPIKEEDTAGTLHDRLAELGAKLLTRTLNLLTTGNLPCRPQENHLATYAPPLTKKDEFINWEKSARAVFNHVRGMDPWPGACTCLNDRIIKIWQVRAVDEDAWPEGVLPGQVLIAQPEKGLVVQANPGLVLVKEIQMPGGKRLPVADFLRGHPISAETILGGKGILYS